MYSISRVFRLLDYGFPEDPDCLRKWEAARQSVRDEMRAYIEETLRSGGAVAEMWGQPIIWSLKGTRRWLPDGTATQWQHAFIEACRTPEYLAAHIENRAYGFGLGIAVIVDRELLSSDYTEREKRK